MKVLQLGKFYPIRGGVEKVMYDLMLGLSETGVNCDMLCASTENHPAGEIQINTFAKVIVVPTKLKLAATMLAPSLIWKLKKIVKNYDVIHIHHPDPMAALALFMSGYKGKVVLHWHSDILKQKNLLKIYSPLQSWLINRADLIVGTTPVYVDQSPFLNHVKEKLNYIPIGVEPIIARQDLVDKILEENRGKFLVFSLGRLVEYKGYEFLIKSAQFLEDNYKIIIAGKGPLFESLQNLIYELNVQDKVELLGFVSDELSHAYFQACDTFVLSSILKTEAFAIVQIEAMSCGKPIISTEIQGSGVQWVNQNGVSGIVVPPNNDRKIAEAIQLLATNNKKYEQLSEQSAIRYSTLFTRSKMVDKCVRLYEYLFSLNQ